jgi:hypothetical protein
MSYPQLLTPEEKLADAKTGLNIPTIVVLCGSTRFMQDMTDLDRNLTWAGNIVIKPGCDMKTPNPLWADPDDAEAGKQRLDDLHRAKIRLANHVLVVGDYVGDSTRAEIAYARSLGKPVIFTHPEVDPTRTCSRCKGTAIAPEHSGHAGGTYEFPEEPYLEPCASCCQHLADGEAQQ